MTDLNQLVEAGARALAAKAIRERRAWDTPRERVEEMLPNAVDIAWRDFADDSRAHLTAILPLLADDLAGVCNRLSRPVGGGDGSTYTCGTSFDAAQAIRTRISALVGESQ